MYYYLKDHLGSIRAVIDSAGNVCERNDYYPFGLCSPEDAALMKEDFYEEAKLWRYTAQKEVLVCRGK